MTEQPPYELPSFEEPPQPLRFRPEAPASADGVAPFGYNRPSSIPAPEAYGLDAAGDLRSPYKSAEDSTSNEFLDA